MRRLICFLLVGLIKLGVINSVNGGEVLVVKRVSVKDPILFNRLSMGIRDASRYYGLPEDIFWSLAKVESNYNFGAVNVNKNKSVDYGVFQINSANLKRWNIPVEFALDPYWASFLAGFVLKSCYLQYGNTWKTIDCYNKGKKASEGTSYVWKVYHALKHIRSQYFSQSNAMAR